MYSETPLQYQNALIRNDGFWPDIDCGDFEKTRDLSVRISASAVRNALMAAVVMINLQLAHYQQRLRRQGICRAADIGATVYCHVPGAENSPENPDSAGQVTNAAQALYIRAVYAMAKSDLIPESQATGQRERWPGEQAETVRRALLTESAVTVRALLGVPRASVALID